MKLSDLKDGMVVELKDGEKFLYIKGQFIGEGYGFDDGAVTEDLRHCSNHWTDRKFDIVKVYEINTFPIGLNVIFYPKFLNLIWERKEKPKLTEDEKVILSNILKEYKYIARDEDGALNVYINKPHKNIDVYCVVGGVYKSFDVYNHLFQMVQWEDEEPTLIEELLEGE